MSTIKGPVKAKVVMKERNDTKGLTLRVVNEADSDWFNMRTCRVRARNTEPCII